MSLENLLMCFQNRTTKRMAYCTVLQRLSWKDSCLQIFTFPSTFLFLSSFSLNFHILHAAIRLWAQVFLCLLYLCFSSYGFDFWVVFTWICLTLYQLLVFPINLTKARESYCLERDLRNFLQLRSVAFQTF